MNKKNLDYSNEIDDISTDIDAVQRAQKRLQRNQTKKDDAPIAQAHLHTPAPRPERDSQPSVLQQDLADPWVPVSNKARLSKKRLLKKLSQDREWAGLQPHTMQDLLDEALDHIFSKYLQTD